MSEEDWDMTIERALERVESMTFLELQRCAGSWHIEQLETIQLAIATAMAVNYINEGEWW